MRDPSMANNTSRVGEDLVSSRASDRGVAPLPDHPGNETRADTRSAPTPIAATHDAHVGEELVSSRLADPTVAVRAARQDDVAWADTRSVPTLQASWSWQEAAR